LESNNKQRVLITEDGYTFYEQSDGAWADSPNGQVDMILTDKELNLPTFPGYEITTISSHSLLPLISNAMDGVYKLPLHKGYKWAFRLNETDIILSRTKKQAQCQFVKFCAMDIKERKKAFYELSDKERDWI
tara:strand:- start:1764 stop:2159 length:396 start_codon:yes stop_codon:yes gene_type:complete